MRTILLGFLLLSILHLSAQRECVTQLYTEQIKTSGSQVAQNIAAAEMFLQQASVRATASSILATSGTLRVASSTTAAAGAFIIRIPVVVHVLYNTAAQNIPDEQIKSQMEALNRDFRRTNADTINTPNRFKIYAADVQIEFALATVDAKGRATNGIVRKQTAVKEWQMDDKIKFSAQGGDDAWDSNNYLNFWVGNTKNLLGYSSVVGGPANKDGVVINTTAFGTINTAAPYNMGRTAVHEVGHWLGLKHIWGDTYCGDDAVDDTPKQGGFTAGCPSGYRTTCNNGSLGDMYMNYMDFTNDACLNMFTQGQKQRMRSLFIEGGTRYAMLFSKGLTIPWVEEAPATEVATIISDKINPLISVQMYPNPVVKDVVLNFGSDASWVGKQISIINSNGVLLQKVSILSTIQTISVLSLPSGVYFIQGENNGKKLSQKLIKL